MAKKGPQQPLLFGEGVKQINAWLSPRPGGLDLTPDAARLLYLDWQAGALVCRDTLTSQEIWRQPLYANHLCVSPDGERVALSTGQGRLFMFDTNTGRLLGEHQAGEGPRGKLAWSPDGSQVLAVHAHSKPQLALLDRDGKHLSFLTAPQEVSSALFVDDDHVVVTNFQSNIVQLSLRSGAITETFTRPGFEIGVAASRDYIALTRDHGHLLLRPARAGAPLPDAASIKEQNQPIYDERMARNALRLQKIRDQGSIHTLNWEKNGAEQVWRKGSPAAGWELWLPLPHCQIQSMRFVSDSLLLMCDGRDVSLLSVGATIKERLLLGLFPIVGQQGYIPSASYRAGVAAMSIDSSNQRLPAQIVIVELCPLL